MNRFTFALLTLTLLLSFQNCGQFKAETTSISSGLDTRRGGNSLPPSDEPPDIEAPPEAEAPEITPPPETKVPDAKIPPRTGSPDTKVPPKAKPPEADNPPSTDPPGQLPPTGNIPPINTTIYVDDFQSASQRAINSRQAIQEALNEALNISLETNKLVTINFGPHTYPVSCPEAQARVGKSCKFDAGKVAKPCFKLSSPWLGTGKILLKGHGLSSKIEIKESLPGAFFIEKLDSIAINGLTIDHKELPHAAGYISNIKGQLIEVTTYPQSATINNTICDCINNNKGRYESPIGRIYGMVVQPNILRFKRTSQQQKMGTAHGYSHCQRLSKTVTLLRPSSASGNSEIKYFKKGDRLIQLLGGDYRGSAFFLNRNNHVEINNLRVQSTAGTAILVTDTAKTINIKNSIVDIPPKSGRLLSTNADGIHLSSNRAKTIIENNKFAKMADDGINSHVRSLILQSPGARVLKVKGYINMRPGDLLQVYSPTTGEIFGLARIQSVSAFNRDIRDIRLTTSLRKTAPTGSHVANVNMATPGIRIRNNIFRWNRGRDITLRSHGAIIEGNHFNAINWSGIMLRASMGIWNEGPVPKNITIQNNKFKGGDFVEISPLLIAPNRYGMPHGPTNINILNNSFCDYLSPLAIGSYNTSVFRQTNNSFKKGACN